MINFNRTDFFPIRNKTFSYDLNDLFKDIIIDIYIKDNFEIKDISSLEHFRKKSIVFVFGKKDISKFKNLNVLIVTDTKDNLKLIKNNVILVNNLNQAYKIFVNYLYNHDDCFDYDDDLDFINGSYISKFCNIDRSVKIGKNCTIGRGVKISKNVIIKDNTSIKNAIIGDNVVICDNTTIGSTGFGFDFNYRGSSNLSPQIGIVYIDSNSHIGSNCCIDRGKIDFTYIGKNCMIDNLVHIAHNVYLSDNACIAAQSGISGSVTIGKNVTIGGQSGFAGHINIGDNVIIAAKSGVTKNVGSNKIVAGFPATDIKLWKKNIIKERKNGYK